jgi:hypothetical protein
MGIIIDANGPDELPKATPPSKEAQLSTKGNLALEDLRATSRTVLDNCDAYAATKSPNSPEGRTFFDSVEAFKDKATSAYYVKDAVNVKAVRELLTQTAKALSARSTKLGEDSIQAAESPGRLEWLTGSAKKASEHLGALSWDARSAEADLIVHRNLLGHAYGNVPGVPDLAPKQSQHPSEKHLGQLPPPAVGQPGGGQRSK